MSPQVAHVSTPTRPRGCAGGGAAPSALYRREVEHPEAVVLAIEGEEGQSRTLGQDRGAEHCLIPAQHLLEAQRALEACPDRTGACAAIGPRAHQCRLRQRQDDRQYDDAAAQRRNLRGSLDVIDADDGGAFAAMAFQPAQPHREVCSAGVRSTSRWCRKSSSDCGRPASRRQASEA
jgi:hypothetical protein